MFDEFNMKLCIVFTLKLSSSYAIYIGLRIPVLILSLFSSSEFDHFCKLMGSGNLDIICSNYGYEKLVSRGETLVARGERW